MTNTTKIGTYNERSLHAALKLFYEPNVELHEVDFKGYIADIKNDDGIIEIQTGSLYKMRTKLECFLEFEPVTVVYPAIRSCRVIWLDPETGELTKPRRSPKTGSLYNALPELYGISELLWHERLTLQLVEVDVEEYRRLDGWSVDKKKGATKLERVPVGMGESLTIKCPADCRQLIPSTLDREFTAAEFGRATRLSGRRLWQAMKLLVDIGLLEYENRAVGRAKKYVYRRSEISKSE